MIFFSKFTPFLTVFEFKINIRDLDYIELGSKLKPTRDIITINSNFINKTFHWSK